VSTTVDDARQITQDHTDRFAHNTYTTSGGHEIEIDDTREYAVPDASAGDNAAHLHRGRVVLLPRWMARLRPTHDATWDGEAVVHGNLVAAWGVADHDLLQVVSTLIESARALDAGEREMAGIHAELRAAADDLDQAWRMEQGSPELRRAVGAGRERLRIAIAAAEPYLTGAELAEYRARF
jgi:hypothetical protein